MAKLDLGAVADDDELLTSLSGAMTEANDPDDGYAALYRALAN